MARSAYPSGCGPPYVCPPLRRESGRIPVAPTTLRPGGQPGSRVLCRSGRASGVEWKGRNYDRTSWKNADPINRALSCANSCLYGLCHAAIVAAGYSPAIGFVHSGKALSFVYDVADLYKTVTSIPAAFGAVNAKTVDMEGTVRRAMRDMFLEERLLERILPDLAFLFEGFGEDVEASLDSLLDSDDALPSGLWDPEAGSVEDGVNYAEETDGSDDPGTGSAEPAG